MSEDLNDLVSTEAEDTTLAPQEADDIAQNEQPGDDPAANADEAPKPKKSAQQRIDELTWKAREAERQAEYWRERAFTGAQSQPQPAPAPQAQADDPPNPADYQYGDTDAAFIRNLARYETRRELEAHLAQRDQEQRARTAVEGFKARIAQQYPDGEPQGIAILARLPELSQAIVDVIHGSEVGPKLADHLGSNLGEVERLSALPAHLQAYELAKIEQRLASTPAPKPNTITQAPQPTPQVRGTGGRFTVAPDTSDFAAFEKQYGG